MYTITLVQLVRDATLRPFSLWKIVKDKGCFERWRKAKPAQCFHILPTKVFARGAQPKRVISWSMFLEGLKRPIKVKDGVRR